MAIRQFKGSSEKNYPAVSLTKRDPKLAAMISKMTSSPHGTTRDSEGNRKTLLTSTFGFRNILQKRAKRNADAQSILRLLPDIELSAQILISSILSPKDMTSLELLYMGPKALLSPELSAKMINRLKEHFEDHYKIKPLLTEMLREPLFEKGSYPIAVIPENSIDDFINGNGTVSMEALADYVRPDGVVRNIGMLGPHDGVKKSRFGVALESSFGGLDKIAAEKIVTKVHYKDGEHDVPSDFKEFVACEFLTVIDNPSVLKIPKLNARTKTEAVKKQYAQNGMKVALEEAVKTPLSDQKIENAIYPTRQYASDPIASLKKSHELKRKSVGGPLIMKLPSESVIPVHVPGNVKQHIGYFVILDEEGNPVEIPDGDQNHAGLAGAGASASSSLASNLIRKVESNMGTGSTFDPMSSAHMDFAARVYADMVERDLISRIKNGVYGSNASLAKNDEVYRIMLSRVLAKKYTQVLYLPVEFMTYIAFKYGDDGVGRSLLDDTAMINTLRSVMLFTDVLAAVKNSIGRTKVTANIPENDPNPMKTLEHAQDEIVRSRMLGIPLGVSNPTDIFEFIQRAGYEWEINGSNKGLPDLKFEFQQTSSSYTKPDSDLQNQLRKSSISAFGLSPETVDNGFNTEFAATALANNILLSKRVILHQDIFTPLLSDHLRKVAMNTEELINDLKAILTEKPDGIKIDVKDVPGVNGANLTDEVKTKMLINRALNEFLAGFYVELPRPSSVTLEAQLKDLETYTDGLDKALDAFISSEFFTASTAGEISAEAGTIKAMVKAHYIRKWLADKGIMPELSELISNDEEGNPQRGVFNATSEHIKALARAGITALANLSPMVQAANKDFAALKVEASEPIVSSDSGSGGDSFDFGSDFGGGDLELDLDLSDDPATPDATEENKTDEVTIPSEEEEAAKKAAEGADPATPPAEDPPAA